MWDLILILSAFFYAIVCYQYRKHNLSHWIHFLTLLFDLFIHIFFTRTSGYLLSPLMAIHPFLCAAFLLLFHNPLFILPSLLTHPFFVVMTIINSESTNLFSLLNSLIICTILDALAVFFIHLTQSKEHQLLQSMIVLDQKLKELAVVKERQRIARDFHDGVGAKIASIIMQCDYLQMTSKQKGITLPHELNEIKDSAAESIDDMRRSIAFLNDDFNIKDQIDLIIDKIISRHEISIEKYNLHLLEHLSLEQQIACCRITQEAITNTLKHAKARVITLSVSKGENRLSMIVEDDGIGFKEKLFHNNHFGIKNMTERARSIGASLTFSAKQSHGTKIVVEIPCT